MRPVRYHDLVFQPDMLAARRDDGEAIRLTRQERALLLRLVRQPQALVTRGQLLSALGDEDGALGERAVDYLVNRLRKRLGDSARAPRFLATQYGEGYVWIAEPVEEGPVSAFLVIGPVFGLADGRSAGVAMDMLAAAIRSRLDPGRTVTLLPQWQPGTQAGGVDFALEAGSHEDEAGQLHLALVLREAAMRRTVATMRRTLARGDFRRETDEIARLLIDALWRDASRPPATDPAPGDRPIHLRMHDAALMLTADIVSWRENEPRLRAALAAAPGDPALRVLLALNGYARLLQDLADTGSPPIDDAGWAAVEDEIEALALGAIGDAGGDPMLLLGIAKVLHFVDRGHAALIEELTETAFAASTAFAAVFAMKAQIATSRGDIGGTLAFYDKAIELAEAGTQFHVYLMVLKAIALMAGGQRAALDEMLPELYERDPPSRTGLGLFFASPQARRLPGHLDEIVRSSTPDTARAAILHLHRIGARYYPRPAQRRNVLRGAATHLVRRHGRCVIPPALAALRLVQET